MTNEHLSDVNVILGYVEKVDWFITQVKAALHMTHDDDFIHTDTFVDEDDKVNYHFIGYKGHEERLAVDPVIFTDGYEEMLDDEMQDVIYMISGGKPISVELH